jgi:hypothetical protein
MGFEKKSTGTVCALCGAVLAWNCVHTEIECRRDQLCAQPALHQPDMPERHPAQQRTTGFVVAVTSTSATSSLGSLGTLFYLPRK